MARRYKVIDDDTGEESWLAEGALPAGSGNVSDGGNLSIGLLFPDDGVKLRDGAETHTLTLGVSGNLTGNRTVSWVDPGGNVTLDLGNFSNQTWTPGNASEITLSGNETTVLHGDGTFSQAVPCVGLTGNFTDTGTTLGDVTGLALSVAANERCLIVVQGMWDSSVVTSGMNFAFTGPSSPASVLYDCAMFTGATTIRTAAGAAMATAFGTTLLQGNSPGTGGVPFWVILLLENGANAGTVQFRATNETSSVTLKIYRGTVMYKLKW